MLLFTMYSTNSTRFYVHDQFDWRTIAHIIIIIIIIIKKEWI